MTARKSILDHEMTFRLHVEIIFTQGRRNDLVSGTAIKFKQWVLLLFKQYMIYFEKNMGNFGQAMAVPAVPLPTALSHICFRQRYYRPR